MDHRKAIGTAPGTQGAAPLGRAKGWNVPMAAVALATAAFLAQPPAATAAPAGQPAVAEAPGTRAILDPTLIIDRQMRLEKTGDKTAMFSKGLKTVYDAVPRDQENLGLTIFGGGFDVPDRIVEVSAPTYDPTDPRKASVKVTLHCNNPDADPTSFNRTLVIAFVEEGGRWGIDDVRMIDQEKAGREIWLKSGFQALAEPDPAPADEAIDPACVRSMRPVTDPGDPVLAAGFKPLTDLDPHPNDPNRETVETKFVNAIGSVCPFRYQLVDLNGDGLADLVLQLADRRLGATDAGLQRTIVYTLDSQGKWQPAIDGLARSVLVRADRSGGPEVALAGLNGEAYKAWSWRDDRFVPN
jgi:hypothetical protein